MDSVVKEANKQQTTNLEPLVDPFACLAKLVVVCIPECQHSELQPLEYIGGNSPLPDGPPEPIGVVRGISGSRGGAQNDDVGDFRKLIQPFRPLIELTELDLGGGKPKKCSDVCTQLTCNGLGTACL